MIFVYSIILQVLWTYIRVPARPGHGTEKTKKSSSSSVVPNHGLLAFPIAQIHDSNLSCLSSLTQPSPTVRTRALSWVFPAHGLHTALLTNMAIHSALVLSAQRTYVLKAHARWEKRHTSKVLGCQQCAAAVHGTNPQGSPQLRSLSGFSFSLLQSLSNVGLRSTGQNLLLDRTWVRILWALFSTRTWPWPGEPLNRDVNIF